MDSLSDGKGGKVNGRFDPSTGVIDIALDADGNAYAYVIEEMEYEYDGLILDEGGVPDGDDGVKSRGLSYVIFDPAQAKAVDN